MQKENPSFIIEKAMKKPLVLFSGGIDSTTALHWALARSEHIQALTFDYGQRHAVEIRMSRAICRRLNVPQRVFRVDLRQVGGSALTDTHMPLTEVSRVEQIGSGIPGTYVPFRNGVFLSLAAAWADFQGLDTLVCGFHVIDSPNYPDTREPFVQAMERAINLGTRTGASGEKIRIQTPFADRRKSEIIRMGLSLGADYAYSVSCYAGGEVPCLRCSSCFLRQQAWAEVGEEDPLIRRLEKEGKL